MAWTFATTAMAFEADPTPSDNLVQNPWFRSDANPNLPGFDGWQRYSKKNGSDVMSPLWGTSQKADNPSPDQITSADCGNTLDYCGTGARWAEDRPQCLDNAGRSDTDAYVAQVIEADDSHLFLKFHTWWVSHKIEVLEVNIYGSQSGTGGWELLWQPFSKSFTYDAAASVSTGGDRSEEWTKLTETTPMVEAQIEQGWPFYKLEIHARYTKQGTDCSVGAKVTGVYFATAASGDAPVTEPPDDPDAGPESGSGGDGSVDLNDGSANGAGTGNSVQDVQGGCNLAPSSANAFFLLGLLWVMLRRRTFGRVPF